jgi:hypothetical protein
MRQRRTGATMWLFSRALPKPPLYYEHPGAPLFTIEPFR